MQDQCECGAHTDADCWCEGKGRIPALDDVRGGLRRARMRLLFGMEPLQLRRPRLVRVRRGEPQCHSFAPMAFKGNFMVEMCIDCSDVTVADDLGWAPDGSIPHGSSMGWCYSDLDELIGCTASPGDCWAMCEDAYGDDLVAIDWEDGECYCQNDCLCMAEAGQEESYLITREGFGRRSAALSYECSPGEGEDADEDPPDGCACVDFAMAAMTCDDYIASPDRGEGWSELDGVSACGWIEANRAEDGYAGCDGCCCGARSGGAATARPRRTPRPRCDSWGSSPRRRTA